MSPEFTKWWSENWGWVIGIFTLILMLIPIIKSSKDKNKQNIKSGKNSINIQSGKNTKINNKNG